MKRLMLFVMTAIAMMGFGLSSQAWSTTVTTDPENTLVMETTIGTVVIELLPEVAPQHVERLKSLAREGFYDGIKFHRVIPGFMAQTGDPNSKEDNPRIWGMGGSDLPDLPAEFNETPFERGTVGMARSSNPNSANSQFFICFRSTPHLNGQYTVFGQVVEGMKFVDRIAEGEPPRNPDEIVSMRVLADIQ